MSVSKFDDIMKSVTAKYKELQISYNNAAVEDKTIFGPLLMGVGELIAIGASIAFNPSTATLLMKLVLSCNTVLKVIEISIRVFNYFAGIADDSDFQRQVESDIKLLKKSKEEIEVRVKDLGSRVVKELYRIQSILNVKNTQENQLKFAMLIGEFNYHVHMICVDVKQCQARLSSIETKVNEKLNLRLGLVIGGSVASGVAGLGTIGTTVAAILMTNPVTAIIGAVGLAGLSIAGGVVAGVQDARRRSELENISKLENIKKELVDYQATIKSHVDMLIAADIPVANVFK